MKQIRNSASEYENGRIARLEGRGRDKCPSGLSVLLLRHWWLAGWHDMDMELNSQWVQ